MMDVYLVIKGVGQRNPVAGHLHFVVIGFLAKVVSFRGNEHFAR